MRLSDLYKINKKLSNLTIDSSASLLRIIRSTGCLKEIILSLTRISDFWSSIYKDLILRMAIANTAAI